MVPAALAAIGTPHRLGQRTETGRASLAPSPRSYALWAAQFGAGDEIAELGPLSSFDYQLRDTFRLTGSGFALIDNRGGPS